jgi:ornithine cyclodeaminase
MTDIYNRWQLEEAISPEKLIPAIEEGFIAYSQGKVVVPPVGQLLFDDPPGDCHIKYGYVRGGSTFTIKVATGFYGNAALGIPSGDGIILVFSAKTGQLITILDDKGFLTDARTAAAGAVAAKLLAPRAVSCIGIVGAGVQAKMQLDYLRHVVPTRRAMVWARSLKKARLYNVEGFDVEVAGSIAHLAANCNLIVTTTPSLQWLLGAADVRPGTHVTAVGCDGSGKQELDPQLFAKATVRAVDSRKQCAEYGDSSYAVKQGLIAAADLVEIGEIAQNASLGRQTESEITIADLTGVAVQDIQIAKLAVAALGKQLQVRVEVTDGEGAIDA